MKPQLVLLAGPNGAGKSTFYAEFLSQLHLPFINADIFAARTGMSSFEAARVLDSIRNELIEQGAGFISETVFSDRVGAKLGMLRKAVAAGYDVCLIYIAVEPALCGLRIDQRVATGGHDVPRDRIAGRFKRSLKNLRDAIAFIPLVKIYDNSSMDEPFRLVAIFESGTPSLVASPVPQWARTIMGGSGGRRVPKR